MSPVGIVHAAVAVYRFTFFDLFMKIDSIDELNPSLFFLENFSLVLQGHHSSSSSGSSGTCQDRNSLISDICSSSSSESGSTLLHEIGTLSPPAYNRIQHNILFYIYMKCILIMYISGAGSFIVGIGVRPNLLDFHPQSSSYL
jgi:hypothetical protein